MDKTLIILGFLTLAVIAVTAGMVVMPSPANTGDTSAYDIQDGALTIAKQFVTDDPTFKFDGMPETLKAELNESSGSTATVTVDFTSRQAGYGDRAGMMLAQVLTPHRCVLTISGSRVQSAVMDNTWDMLSQTKLG